MGNLRNFNGKQQNFIKTHQNQLKTLKICRNFMICAAEMTFDKCPSVAVGKAECYPMKKADYCIEHEIIGKIGKHNKKNWQNNLN